MAIANRTTALVNPSTGPTWDTWVGRDIPPVPAGITGRLLGFPADVVYAAIDGTFGAGGSIKLSFSDDNFVTSTDYAAFTAALPLTRLSTALPHRYWRAQVTAGDGTTSLNVSLTSTP